MELTEGRSGIRGANRHTNLHSQHVYDTYTHVRTLTRTHTQTYRVVDSDPKGQGQSSASSGEVKEPRTNTSCPVSFPRDPTQSGVRLSCTGPSVVSQYLSQDHYSTSQTRRCSRHPGPSPVWRDPESKE